MAKKSSSSIAVDFINLAKNNLSSLPVKNGQVIAFNDAEGLFYDMGGTRRAVSNIKFVTSAPTSGRLTDTLYIIVSSSSFELRIWTGSKWIYMSAGVQVAALTKSQYNALTPAQKTDGTIRFITDGPVTPL